MFAHRLPFEDWVSSEGELERYTEEARARDIALDLKASAITTRFATDYRFNRRDSIVFQFQAMIWNDVLTDIKNAEEIPPILQFEEAFAKDQSGVVPIGDSFVTGLAYQAAWNHLEIRVGAGYSAIPFAWLLQSMELSWRFGGTTRSTERRMRRTWGRNRADIED